MGSGRVHALSWIGAILHHPCPAEASGVHQAAAHARDRIAGGTDAALPVIRVVDHVCEQEEIGRDVLSFRREDGVAENFHTSQNRELLEKLAQQTPSNLDLTPVSDWKVGVLFVCLVCLVVRFFRA